MMLKSALMSFSHDVTSLHPTLQLHLQLRWLEAEQVLGTCCVCELSVRLRKLQLLGLFLWIRTQDSKVDPEWSTKKVSDIDGPFMDIEVDFVASLGFTTSDDTSAVAEFQTASTTSDFHSFGSWFDSWF